EAENFISLGADFVVAPIVTPSVGDIAHSHDLLWIPGCMTPTEIALAQQNKASLITLFPADVLGPGFLSAIKELFEGQLFMPTGGVAVGIGDWKSWFGAGGCAVGMGSKLLTPTQVDGLAAKTKQALALVAQAKMEIEK